MPSSKDFKAIEEWVLAQQPLDTNKQLEQVQAQYETALAEGNLELAKHYKDMKFGLLYGGTYHA